MLSTQSRVLLSVMGAAVGSLSAVPILLLRMYSDVPFMAVALVPMIALTLFVGGYLTVTAWSTK